MSPIASASQTGVERLKLKDEIMHELIEAAMAASGGLDRWKRVREISLTLSVSGAGLQARGPVGEAARRLPMRVTVDSRMQRVGFEPYLVEGHRGTYEPHRTAVHSEDGIAFETLDEPREALKAMPAGRPWSASQLVYFFGYSLWMYCTLPFSFLSEGIQVEEVEPWIEAGETWRGVKVVFPDSFPAHSSEQIHYFDPTGLMRRQDYTVDVRQNLSAAHYLDDNQSFDGFVFPTKRRIYPAGPDRAPIRGRVLIAADLSDYRVAFD